MESRDLVPAEGHRRPTAVISALASQLDLLLRSVTARVKDASVAELEWQLRPGINTCGMLLAHMALSETFWIQAGARGIDSDDVVDKIVRATLGLGINDDGMPLPPDGIHPPALAGKTAADYLELLRRARQATEATLSGWDDADLERTVVVDGRAITLLWIVSHIINHFAQHAGQIALLTSLRRASAGGGIVTKPL